jgi:ketosteroid isomerase-like protein
VTPEAVVRRFFELGPRGDPDAITELLDPNVVWFGTRGGLDENRVVRGPSAFLEYLREIDDTWTEYDVEVESVITDDETAVAFLQEKGRGRGALDVHNDTAAVFRIRDGRIAEARGYLDRKEALAAAQIRA